MIEPDEELIRPTAARYARRYRLVERDDIAQELRLWWLTNQRAVARYTREEEPQPAKLAKALNRAAERYCRQIKAQSVGYRVEDEFFYNAGLVRELLPMVWKPELVIQDTQPDEGGRVKSGKPANEGNNLLAMVADVSRAFDAITDDHRRILFAVYFFGETNEHIADRLVISVPAVKMRVQRAVDALVDELGGRSPYDDDYEGPGSRRAISNAHAAAITSNQEIG